MASKTVPFTKAEIESIIETTPTPFHIYDEKAILDNVRALKAAFAWLDFASTLPSRLRPIPIS